MDEKTGRNPIAGRSKPTAIGLSAGEIDLGGVLRDNNPTPRGRREAAPGQGAQHLLAAHRWGRQKTVDRQFAGTRLTQLADHQRSGRRHPFNQLGAERRSSCIPEIAQRPRPFHHDDPPFKTGSENRGTNRFTRGNHK